MKLHVFIVVPNWNGEDFIQDCLVSLQKQTISATVVVVDNGSKDRSTEIVKEKFPKVHLIQHEENEGFAGGVNSGIRYAQENRADYIALFNNDAVADKYWLEKLVTILDTKPQAAIATGKFMRSDNKRFDSTGDFYSKRGIPFPRGRNEIDKGQYDKQEQVFAASGGASLYRAMVLQEIGLFDERFFAYFEDVDISFRARLAGYEIWYTPEAIATHKVGGTSSKLGNFAQYHANKNFYYLFIKNMPFPLSVQFLPSFCYQAIRSAAASIKNRRFLNYLHALCTVLLHIPGVILSRWRIQRHKKISAHDIKKWLQDKPPKTPELEESL